MPRLNSIDRANLVFLQELPTDLKLRKSLDVDTEGNLRIRSIFHRAVGYFLPIYDSYINSKVAVEVNRLMGRLDSAAFGNDTNGMKKFIFEKAATLSLSIWDRRLHRETYNDLKRLVPVEILEKCDDEFQKLYATSQLWFHLGSYRRPLKGGASGSYEIIKGALIGLSDQVVEDGSSLAIYKPSDQAACGANNPSRIRRTWSVILKVLAKLPILRLLGGSIEISCNGPEGRVAEEVSSRISDHIKTAVQQFMNSPQGAELTASARGYLNHLLEEGFVPPTKAIWKMGRMGAGSLQKWVNVPHSSLKEVSDSPSKVVPFSLLQLLVIRDVVQGQCDSTKSNLLVHWGLDQQRKLVPTGISPIDGWFAMPRKFPDGLSYIPLRNTYPWAKWQTSQRPFNALGKAVIAHLASVKLNEEIQELYNRQLSDSIQLNEERVERMNERMKLLSGFVERGLHLSEFDKIKTGWQAYYQLGVQFSETLTAR